MIEFRCPHPGCNRLIEVTQEVVGKTISCPHCYQGVAVPFNILFPESPSGPAPGSREAEGAPAPSPEEQGSGGRRKRFWRRRGSRPGALWHVVRAVLFTVAFYVLLAFLQESPVGQWTTYPEKFINRGWTQYACVLLTFWSLSILVGKWRSVRRRGKCLAETTIPGSARLDTDQGTDDTLAAVRAVARRYQDDTLANRLQRALEHFRSSRDAQGAGAVLQAESDAAYAELESSYTLVRVFLWTIPILGFIGTVMGIGDAVGGFASFLGGGAQELDQIKDALTKVTSSLAVAFDTTLVALLLSVIVMVYLSHVEKKEKNLLQAYEDFCRERLLRRLSAAPVEQPAESGLLKRLPELLHQAVREALTSVVPGVGFWKTEASKMAQELADSLARTWHGAGQVWLEGLERFRRETETHYALWKEATQNIARHQETVGHLGQEIAALRLAGERQRASVESYSGALLSAAAKLEELIRFQHSLEEKLIRAAGSDGLAATLGGVREGLEKMDPVLRKLAEQPLDVKVHFVAGVASAVAG